MLSKKGYFGLFILVVLLVLTVFFSLKFTVFKGRDSVCPGDRITCENGQGEAMIPVCDENSTNWKCPTGSCDTSHKIPATCVPEDQVCQSDGTYLCVCGQDTNPSQAGCSRGEITKCNENSTWECQCDGHTDNQQMRSDCEDHDGTVVCVENEGYKCHCGSNEFDYTESCTSDGSESNDNLIHYCDPDGSVRCGCSKGGSKAPKSCNDDQTALCTDDGWVCNDDGDVCGSSQPTCSDNEKLYCEPTDQTWYCVGNTCTDKCIATGATQLLSPSNWNTRARFSVQCSMADNMSECMNTWYDNQYKEYNNTDFFGNEKCLPSESSYGVNYCTRPSCPIPISVANMDKSGKRYAGCVFPTNDIDQNITTNYSNISLSLNPLTITDDLKTPVIVVPDYCGGDVPLFVVLPYGPGLKLSSTGDKIQTDWRVFPLMNFHPYLFWRPVPRSNQTFEVSKCDNGKNIQDGKKNYITLPFFTLNHVTTAGRVDTTGCIGDKGDCVCGDGCKYSFNFTLSTLNQLDCLSTYMQTGDISKLKNAPCFTDNVEENWSRSDENLMTNRHWSCNKCSICDTGTIPQGDTFLSMPFTDSYLNPRIGRVIVKKWAPTQSLKMLNDSSSSSSTKFMAMGVSTKIMGSTTFFTKYQENGGLKTPYAPYPLGTKPTYDDSLDKCIISPLQYSLNTPAALGSTAIIASTMLEAYDWNDDFTDWKAIGILSTPIEPQDYSFIDNKCFGNRCKWKIQSTQLNAYNTDDCNKQSTATQVVHGWTIKLYDQNDHQLKMSGITSTTDDSNDPTGFQGSYYSPMIMANQDGTFLTLDGNGYLYYGIFPEISFYLCLVDFGTGGDVNYRLYAIAIQTIDPGKETININNVEYPFICPMWSLVNTG